MVHKDYHYSMINDNKIILKLVYIFQYCHFGTRRCWSALKESKDIVPTGKWAGLMGQQTVKNVHTDDHK